MSWQHLAWAYELKALKGPAKPILVALADQSDSDAECWPGQQLLADMTGVSTKTVERACQRLERLGLIERMRRHTKSGHRTSDRFHLHTDVTPAMLDEALAAEHRPDRLTDTPPTRQSAYKAESLQDSQSGLTDTESGQEELRSSDPLETPQTLIEPDEGVDDSPEPLAAHLPTIEEMFDAVWEAWPRKVDKRDARKAFVKALVKIHGNRLEATQQLVAAIHAWRRQWLDVEQRTIDKVPHFATWLNAERWTDEIPELDVRALAPNHPAGRARPLLPPAPVVKNRHCPHGYLPGARRPDDGSLEVCPHADCPTNARAAGGHR